MTNEMRLAIDYTSAVRQGAGVGRYTRSLVNALTAEIDSSIQMLLWYSGDEHHDIAKGAMRSPNVEAKRVVIPDRWLTAFWQRLHLPLQLERLIGPFDVSHSPDFVAPPTAGPNVITVHDLSYRITPEFAHPRLRRYLEHAVPRSVRRAEQVIVPSETTRQDVIEHYGIDEHLVRAIPHGVDPWFQPANESAIEQTLAHFGLRRPYFIIVGTIEPRKNHLNLLAAFERLHKERPDASLAIFGRSGWLSEPIMSEIERYARFLPLRHLQGVEDSWLPALYSGSTALVYPSWYEGFGLPVLEAMACGTMAIVSDRGSLPEIAGKAAMIVPPASIDALAETMKTALDDADLRESYGRRGRVHAAQFRWDESARQHLALYRKVADRS